MIRCGILTFQYAHNYGALLQTYALKTFLNNRGFDVEVINYANQQAKEMYAFFPSKINGVVDFLRKGKRCVLRSRQYRLFKSFSRDYLGYAIENATEEKKLLSGKYYNIIVGSDQVWNKKLTNNDLTYFLENIDCQRRISYAASFGSSKLIESLDSKDVELLRGFDFISVRESDSQMKLQKIIKEKNISLVVDPVFLLNREKWKEIERKPKSIKKKYCCLVMLRDDTELISRCKAIASKMNTEIVSIHPMGWKQKCGRQLFDIGPLEFLWLIDHADFVVTNSFHATAFSAIFGKKVLTGAIAKDNDRISSLISLLSGSNNHYGNDLIDTGCFDTKHLDEIIVKSKEYLLKSLS